MEGNKEHGTPWKPGGVEEVDLQYTPWGDGEEREDWKPNPTPKNTYFNVVFPKLS